MKRFLLYCSFCFLFMMGRNSAQAQHVIAKDSVIQLFGIVMTADSLRALPQASIIVEGTTRGTLTNDQGVFSIAVLQGQSIRFSSVGFKDKTIQIPTNLTDNQYSVIQLLVNDTAFLPATILKPRPSREQFERDFVSTQIPADQIEIARQNTDEATRRILVATLPADGREAVNMQLRQQATRYYYQGQQPPVNLFNPFAWGEFIKAWKRGDFKKKN
ncbi:carboxypeptidase-like regulatory domain-containing protein [Filimonas effusa]|uniref:Carboxypeptidase-like regulatory domain-containing protein n=1 Tax=Filimonas effusa TaxID=2508721 RepID=A0A4Q1D9X1_9BACT|nr:carboxypeptidase-like regulatory domain-containing protein [Filimonas effusa]RXK85259.1 carboxypeptidase-like regulatory domain-containing protein [Filimonas effusa]